MSTEPTPTAAHRALAEDILPSTAVHLLSRTAQLLAAHDAGLRQRIAELEWLRDLTRGQAVIIEAECRAMADDVRKLWSSDVQAEG